MKTKQTRKSESKIAVFLAAITTATLTLLVEPDARGQTIDIGVSWEGTPRTDVVIIPGSTNYYSDMLCIQNWRDLTSETRFAVSVELNSPTNGKVTLPMDDIGFVRGATTNAFEASGVSNIVWAVLGYSTRTGYITNGLALEQYFNGSATDISGYGNNGTLYGSPTYVVGQGGQSNGAISLNGTSQYVADPDATSLHIGAGIGVENGEMTMSGWVKANSFPNVSDPNSDPGSHHFAEIIDKGWGGHSEGFFLRWADINGVVCLQGGANDGTTEVSVSDSSIHYVTGEWYFVTVTAQRGSLDTLWTLYVNGVLVTINHQLYGPISDNNQPVTIGAFSVVTNSSLGFPTNSFIGYHFDGVIDSVALYNRALSAREVELNFKLTDRRLGEEKLDIPDLLYYQMDRKSQAESPDDNSTNITLTDYSTNGLAIGHGDTYGTNIFWKWDQNPLNLFESSSLHFHGVGDAINVEHPELFNLTNQAMTISMWVWPFTPGGTLAANGFFQTNGWILEIDDSYVPHLKSEWLGGEDDVVSPASSGVALDNLTLSMLTVVIHNNNTAEMYINGRQVGYNSGFHPPASSTNALVFGSLLDKFLGTPGHFYHGWLDGDLWSIKIYGRALTSVEIAEIYLREQYGSCSPVYVPVYTNAPSSGGGSGFNPFVTGLSSTSAQVSMMSTSKRVSAKATALSEEDLYLSLIMPPEAVVPSKFKKK